MALNKDKNLKLYFSISEVAQMFDERIDTAFLGERIRYYPSAQDA